MSYIIIMFQKQPQIEEEIRLLIDTYTKIALTTYLPQFVLMLYTFVLNL